MVLLPEMALSLYRRHTESCEHANKGQNYTLCECPIYCDGTLEGARCRRSLNTSDWSRAMRRLGRLERHEDQDFIAESAGRSLGSATAAYIKDARDRGLQESSIANVAYTLKLFCKFALDPDIGCVTTDNILSFRSRMRLKTGKKEACQITALTKQKELGQLRTFFTFCVSRGWIQKNPAKAARAPLVKESPVTPYSVDEVNRLLAACEKLKVKRSNTYINRAKALIKVLAYTGLRVSDVAALKRSALDGNNYITLRTTKTGVPVKLLLNADVADDLRRLPAPEGNITYFFWSGNGRRISCTQSIWKTVSKVGRYAGIHAHPHRFRHTFAVELLTRGADIRSVQKLLGHESIRTTEKHYAHFVAAHQALLDSAISLLDFSGAPGPSLVGLLKK